jgi:hypothetical protein
MHIKIGKTADFTRHECPAEWYSSHEKRWVPVNPVTVDICAGVQEIFPFVYEDIQSGSWTIHRPALDEEATAKIVKLKLPRK